LLTWLFFRAFVLFSLLGLLQSLPICGWVSADFVDLGDLFGRSVAPQRSISILPDYRGFGGAE
jgi:hypothetical protein